MTEISSFAASKTAQYANRPSSFGGRPVGSDEENDENKEDDRLFCGFAFGEDVLVLPAEVVNIGKQGSFCYVLEDGVIAKKNIETGLSSDDYIEVTEGIEEGDTVIRDIGTLQEGMPAEAMASGDAAVTGEGA